MPNWNEVKCFVARTMHIFNVEIVKSLKWRVAGNHLTNGSHQTFRVHITKTRKLLYRKPIYLICTDNELNIEKLSQAYLWRWEIEVNFREEKTINGCGDVQVRNEISAAKTPAFKVAV